MLVIAFSPEAHGKLRHFYSMSLLNINTKCSLLNLYVEKSMSLTNGTSLRLNNSIFYKNKTPSIHNLNALMKLMRKRERDVSLYDVPYNTTS